MTPSIMAHAIAAAAKNTAPPPDVDETRSLVMFGYLSPLVVGCILTAMKVRAGSVTLYGGLVNFALCCVSFLVIFTCVLRAHRQSVQRDHSLLRTSLTSFAVCLVAIGTTAFVRSLLRRSFPELIPIDPEDTPAGWDFLVFAVSNAFAFMWVWGGIFLLPLTLRRAQRQRLEAAEARREAEILRLRAHLEPHFLLNTLNTVAGLVVDDPVEARRMIGLLGDLFRDATGERGRDVHALADEITWLERYAAIHESRHGRMVRFTWEVDPAAGAVPVPRLVLQPLVENAVMHGVLRCRRGGTVSVRARVVGAHLVCEVEDDGPGFSPGPRRLGGHGLRIVERTLALFSSDASLTITSEEGSTRVTARLPLHGALSP